jgi:hypothetical protein
MAHFISYLASGIDENVRRFQTIDGDPFWAYKKSIFHHKSYFLLKRFQIISYREGCYSFFLQRIFYQLMWRLLRSNVPILSRHRSYYFLLWTSRIWFLFGLSKCLIVWLEEISPSRKKDMFIRIRVMFTNVRSRFLFGISFCSVIRNICVYWVALWIYNIRELTDELEKDESFRSLHSKQYVFCPKTCRFGLETEQKEILSKSGKTLILFLPIRDILLHPNF